MDPGMPAITENSLARQLVVLMAIFACTDRRSAEADRRSDDSGVQSRSAVVESEHVIDDESEEHERTEESAGPGNEVDDAKRLSLNRLLRAEDWGLSAEGTWTFDSSVLLSGGVNRGATANRNLLELRLIADTEKLIHPDWKGGNFTFKFQNFRGEHGANDTGDAIFYDNIDNPFALSQLAVAYYEQKLFDDRVRIKIGKVDANSEFNVTESDTPKFNENFLGSGQGNLPTLFATMPTYPDSATSINLFVKPVKNLELGFGIYDGRLARWINTGSLGPDFGGPYVMYGQAGYKFGEERPTRIALGVWRHTFGAFENLNGVGTQDGQNGLYVNVDKTLWRENPNDPKDRQGLHFDFAWGVGDSDVNPFPYSWTVGLDWIGAIDGRDKDIIGIGITQGIFSDRDPIRTRNAETQFELFYLAQITENLQVQPDLTYIRHPGGVANVRQAWVATLRVILEF